MKKSIALFNRGFESSCSKTPEFVAFARCFKKEFTAELESVNATNIVFNVGHFYISGFYTIGNQIWYFSMSDVRFFRDCFRILYRTATSYKDFTGGSNQYCNVTLSMAKIMHK